MQTIVQGLMEKIVPALCRAAAAALPLGLQAVHANCNAVKNTFRLFNRTLKCWVESCTEQQRLQLATTVSCEAVRAGVPAALAQACAATDAALQQQNLQHEQQAVLLRSALEVLWCWQTLVAAWPQKGCCISTTHLAGTVAPTAGLVYTILQQHSIPEPGFKLAAAPTGLFLACNMRAAACTPASSSSSSSTSSASNEERVADLMQSDQLMQMLLLLLAGEVQQQYKQQDGMSVVAAIADVGRACRLAIPDNHSGGQTRCWEQKSVNF
jgi:hypothetical protein